MKYLVVFFIGLVVIIVLANLSRWVDRKLHGDSYSAQRKENNDHKEQNDQKMK